MFDIIIHLFVCYILSTVHNMLYSYYSCDSKSMNLGLFTFSGFSVDCCLNREKVICYQLEENNLPTTECFRVKVKEVRTNLLFIPM